MSSPSSDSETDFKSEPVPQTDPTPPSTADACQCVCSCGKCCCHGDNEPKHCVRCHANFTFNHSDACWVPHVFDDNDEDDAETVSLEPYLSRDSSCCGNRIYACELPKGGLQQPSPCVWGWHTTSVVDVEEKYNGINILRCLPGKDGKCARKPLKYHDEHRRHEVQGESLLGNHYVKADENDRKAFYEKLAAKHGDGYLKEHYDIKLKKRKRRDSDNGPDELTYKKIKPWQPCEPESDIDGDADVGVETDADADGDTDHDAD